MTNTETNYLIVKWEDIHAGNFLSQAHASCNSFLGGGCLMAVSTSFFYIWLLGGRNLVQNLMVSVKVFLKASFGSIRVPLRLSKWMLTFPFGQHAQRTQAVTHRVASSKQCVANASSLKCK